VVDRPQRQHRRYAHEAAITLLAPGQEISGRTFNVSRGGLCATLSEEIAIGTEIQIDIQLVFEHEHRSEALRLPARIAWCTSIDDSHQVGVQFLPLDAETGEYLTIFLRYLIDEDAAKTKQTAVSIDDRFR
jgi:hypothetical protein